MIVRCPSCKSRFSIDSSKIKSPLSKGHCSICGHVFTLLDHAIEDMETAALRDKFEREREEKLRATIGNFGVYGAATASGDKEEASATEEAIPEPAPPAEEPSIPEETEPSFHETETEQELEQKSEAETEAETEMAFGSPEAEEATAEIPTLEENPPEEIPAPPEEEEAPSPQEVEPEMRETALEEPPEAGVETTSEPEIRETETEAKREPVEGEAAPEETPFQPAEKEEPARETNEAPAAEDQEVPPADETLEPFEPAKRSSLLPILIAILILLGIGAGGWYLYQSGTLTSNSLTGGIINKINEIRGKSSLVLFNLKNEQEPARDGKFFAVRGMIQNTDKNTVPFVLLKIKIFDAKGKVILTGETTAGKVLKPEEISRMTVHDALRTYQTLKARNRKSDGRLAPKGKLPFLFLFDLNKFPRRIAKSFQVEIVKAP